MTEPSTLINPTTKPARFTILWFWIGFVGIFLGSLTLRFWGLTRLNTLVFDEVTYVKLAYNYLIHTPVIDPHPPLGKYLIAIAIWIDTHNPLTKTPKNVTEFSQLSALSYRWLNALVGSFVPPIVAGIAYQVSRRRSFALIAGLFASVDGLLLVESRYALINIYIVTFGLLSQFFFLLALGSQRGWRRVWLVLAGVAFGACISVKWNGLWFLLGVYLLWIAAWVMRLALAMRSKTTDPQTVSYPAGSSLTRLKTPLQNLTQISLWQIGCYLGLIPVVVYCLLWIPHMQFSLEARYVPLNPWERFWELHKQMLAFHESLGANIHPDCSRWYTWPLMIRPVYYWHKRVKEVSAQNTHEIVYDIHGMGNPVLWWLSTVAIIFIIGMLVWQIRVWFATKAIGSVPDQVLAVRRVESWCTLYIALNYAVNMLPWVRVTRCTFVYLYMGGSVFSFMALAWLVDRWLQGSDLFLRVVGVTVIFAILWAFVYWSPLWLALPISLEEWQSRRWLTTW